MKEYIFTWSIENINYSWHKTGEELTSPSFIAVPFQNTVWNLVLYPRGIDNSDYLSLYLKRGKDDGPNVIQLNCELSCITTLKSNENVNTLAIDNSQTGCSRFAFRYEIFGPKTARYLRENTLTLRCRMWMDESDDNVSEESSGHTCLQIERMTSVLSLNTETSKTVELESELRNKTLISVSVLRSGGKLSAQIDPIDDGNIMFSTCVITLISEGRTLCERWGSWIGSLTSEKWDISIPIENVVQDNQNEETADENLELRIDFNYSTGKEIKRVEMNYAMKTSIIASDFFSLVDASGSWPALSDDLWNLYQERIFCNVEIKTVAKSFWVHETVLSARSPVFLEMLTVEMKEETSKCIEMLDWREFTVEKLVNYLYFGKFDAEESDTVIELCEAALKYKIERLKMSCTSLLLGNVSIHFVCRLLILADKYKDSDLRLSLEEFIFKDEQKIFSSSTWNEFTRENSLLAVSVMMVKYNKKTAQENLAGISERLSQCPRILDDYTSLFSRRIASDVIIESGGCTFHSHKIILCASSLKLRKILSNDESIGLLKMEDLDENTVFNLLHFLYTDALGTHYKWDAVKKLYNVAIAYQIRRLQLVSSYFLLGNLEISNAIDLLLLADEHHDDCLKSAVEDFIYLLDEDIFESHEWTVFSETNLGLAYETMRRSICKRYRGIPCV